MQLDSDVALLGTGVATLVAAIQLLNQRKTVLILNPDVDFFLEESELPFDPLVLGQPSLERLLKSSPERALEVLRPEYPGPVEFWSSNQNKTGFHDPLAPHVRQRGRLWISDLDQNPLWNWEELESLYIEASDAGLNPQVLENLLATCRFPGFSTHTGNHRGLYIPGLCDVDTVRYRQGLLEYIQEKLGPEKLIIGANQIDWMPEGIRFHHRGSLHTAKIKEKVLVFWTPRLSNWILSHSQNLPKKNISTPHRSMPLGIRLWEHWSLNSRDSPDTSTIGMFQNMAVWADFEGPPDQSRPQLSVLRAGPLAPISTKITLQHDLNWASDESLASLSRLCQDLLKWDRFSVRSMKPRAIFEWKSTQPWFLCSQNPPIQVIPSSDGPLVEVVQAARSACEEN